MLLPGRPQSCRTAPVLEGREDRNATAAPIANSITETVPTPGSGGSQRHLRHEAHRSTGSGEPVGIATSSVVSVPPDAPPQHRLSRVGEDRNWARVPESLVVAGAAPYFPGRRGSRARSAAGRDRMAPSSRRRMDRPSLTERSNPKTMLQDENIRG